MLLNVQMLPASITEHTILYLIVSPWIVAATTEWRTMTRWKLEVQSAIRAEAIARAIWIDPRASGEGGWLDTNM